MGPTFVMLGLLTACYALCAALVLFAEHVIRPRSPEGATPPNCPSRTRIEPEPGATWP
jgi:hypothetical protein